VSPTHSITLTATVEGSGQWDLVYETLLRLSKTMARECSAVTISSYLLEDHVDEQTHFKVSCGLREAGLNDTQITDAINAMQNNGILFRERD
jgi:hypothetical protein